MLCEFCIVLSFKDELNPFTLKGIRSYIRKATIES